MKLWRRMVSVLAGTMIAAGGVLAAAAVIESSPQGSSTVHDPPLAVFNVNTARAATDADAAAISAWLSDPTADDAPTHEERTLAAMGALALSEFSGASSPTGLQSATPEADSSLNRNLDAASAEAVASAGSIVAAENSTPAGAYGGDETPLAAPFTLYLDAIDPRNTFEVDSAVTRLEGASVAVLYAPLSQTAAATAGEPTDVVGLKAAATDVPEPVANWSASAEAEIALRYTGGTLENDTLNVSLASEALRDSDPAGADALNAELRFRQTADGSFGSIRETSEAVRALAQGTSADRAAAVRALNWLDARGDLPAELSVYRLRAHAFDGLLLSMPDVYGQPPAVPAEQGGGAFASTAAPMAISGKGALAFWLLVGGIGLSLSLVTVDALKGSRQRLYDTIRASPGLHVNELRRRLHMSPSSIEYHLAVLVGAGLAVAEDDGRYKRYYANGAGLGLNPRSPNSRNTLGALRRPHAVTLVRALAEREQGATARELSRALAIHESAAARRLAHLEKSGMLVSQREGRARVYRVLDRLAALKALTAVEEAPALVASQPVAPPPTPGQEAAAPQVGATATSQ